MYTCTKVTFRLLLLTDEIKSRVVVIYNRAIVAVTSEWCVNCNTWTGLNTGTLANSADPDQILCCLPQKGRKKIEDMVKEVKKRDREER